MSTNNVLITGTTRGLGKAVAEHFLDRGSRVIGCARTEATLYHPLYAHYKVDVEKPKEISSFFFMMKKKLSHIDVLINNAGVASMNAFATTPIESVQKVFSVNVHGTFLFSQKAISLLRKSKHPRIINMSSIAVPFRLEGEALYAASKSAVEMLTRIMAKELSMFNITCNAIGPSPIATDLIKGVSKEKINRLIKRQAIPQMATTADVIHIVDFLVHPASDAISGQIIYLGGIS